MNRKHPISMRIGHMYERILKSTAYRYVKISILLPGLLALGFLSCQKKPALAPAADSLSNIDPPPMGATTYNDGLKRELAILEALFQNSIDSQKLARIKASLIKDHTHEFTADPHSFETHLANVLLTLPELLHKSMPKDEQERAWLRAKFYFLNRRFIEAATLMSELLKNRDDHVVRNWRARAIFFLGNPDLAINELTAIIDRSGETSNHGLDALYLIGAMSFESNEMDARRLKKGIEAWNRYLKLTEPNTSIAKEIATALAELNRRLHGEHETAKTVNVDRFQPNERYTEAKNAILRAFAREELLFARKLCDDAMKISYDPDIATIKARILFKSGQLDDAMKLFLEITEKDKEYAPGFHYRGMAYMLKGRPKDAILSWQRTLEIDEKYANFHGLKQRIAVAEKMVEPKRIETH